MVPLKKINKLKNAAFLLLSAVLCLTLLSGCTMNWVAVSTVADEDSAVMDETLMHEVEQADVPSSITVEAVDNDAASQNDIAMLPQKISGFDENSITRINVFYDGTMAMMGFVDIPQATSSIYMQVADLIRQKGIFFNANVKLYRIDQNTASLESCELTNQQMINCIGSRSFYISQKMISLPKRIVEQGSSTVQTGTRMNRFIDSFYAVNGLPELAGEQTRTPVAAALENVNDNSLTIVISDLSELFMGNAQLSELIGDLCQKDYSVGIVAIESDFSGFVPIKSGETTWIQWGSMPKGAVVDSYTYYYEFEDTKIQYKIPVAQASGERYAFKRPFYVLMVGRTREMNTHITNLVDSIRAQTPNVNLAYQVFEYDYFNNGYSLEDHVTAVHKSMDQAGNVICYERTATDLPKYQFEMGKLNNNSGSIRHIQFDIVNVPKPTNPDIGFFSDNKYSASLSIAPITDGRLDEPLVLDKSITATICNSREDGTGYSLIVKHPVGVLKRGEYRVTVTVHENRPAADNLKNHFSGFSASVPTQQFYDVFDGSRTYGLDGLLESLSKAQRYRPSTFELGTFQYDIIINEN